MRKHGPRGMQYRAQDKANYNTGCLALGPCEKPVCVLSRFSHVQLFATVVAVQLYSPTVVHQAPLSMGFSRQEYWGVLPCPPPENLPDPGIIPASFMSPT